MKYTILIACISLFILSSCNDSDENTRIPEPVDYREINEKQILEYIEDNNLNADRLESGLYYVIAEEGSGDRPAVTDNVTVRYKGYFLDQKVFDESKEEGISFRLLNTIKGWQEGIPLFKEGGSGTLLIPSHLGYGSRNFQTIPGGSVLIFDVTLLAIN